MAYFTTRVGLRDVQVPRINSVEPPGAAPGTGRCERPVILFHHGPKTGSLAGSRTRTWTLEGSRAALRHEAGGTGRIRTGAWRFCGPRPFFLATVPYRR